MSKLITAVLGYVVSEHQLLKLLDPSAEYYTEETLAEGLGMEVVDDCLKDKPGRKFVRHIPHDQPSINSAEGDAVEHYYVLGIVLSKFDTRESLALDLFEKIDTLKSKVDRSDFHDYLEVLGYKPKTSPKVILVQDDCSCCT